jgi:hypothetical protein
MFSFTKIAGKGYITLNIIRVLNVISLLLVAVASWIMIVVPAMNGDFNFFDATSHFITSGVSLFLIVSEVNLFSGYFARNWPMLSSEHGFTFLGITMIVLGINILGNLNKSPTTEEKLGLAMWRVAIAAGILSLTIGVFNIISSIIFQDRKQGITARQVRTHGAVASSANSGKAFSSTSGSLRRSDSLPTHNATTEERRKSRFGIKLPIRMSGISKPVANDPEQFSKWTARSSPVVPEVQRPPTALHPAYNYQAPPVPPAPSSRYSVVSDMTRF